MDISIIGEVRHSELDFFRNIDVSALIRLYKVCHPVATTFSFTVLQQKTLWMIFLHLGISKHIKALLQGVTSQLLLNSKNFFLQVDMIRQGPSESLIRSVSIASYLFFIEIVCYSEKNVKIYYSCHRS